MVLVNKGLNQRVKVTLRKVKGFRVMISSVLKNSCRIKDSNRPRLITEVQEVQPSLQQEDAPERLPGQVFTYCLLGNLISEPRPVVSAVTAQLLHCTNQFPKPFFNWCTSSLQHTCLYISYSLLSNMTHMHYIAVFSWINGRYYIWWRAFHFVIVLLIAIVNTKMCHHINCFHLIYFTLWVKCDP